MSSPYEPAGLGEDRKKRADKKYILHLTERPDRCFANLYKDYCSHRPKDVTTNAFYLAPIAVAPGVC